MGVINITKRDILRSTLLPGNYYLVEIQNVTEAQSKDGQSINYSIDEAEVITDEFGDAKFQGVPTPRWSFNSKAIGFIIPFLEAVTGEKITDPTRIKWDNETLKGKKLYVFIGPKKLEDDRVVNEIKPQYKHYGG